MSDNINLPVHDDVGARSATPGSSGKRKRSGVSSSEVTPTSFERQSFDYFANLKSARKKLKFGSELEIKDIKLGTSKDGLLQFRVLWNSGLVFPPNGKKRYFKFLCVDDTGRISAIGFEKTADDLSKIVQTGKAYKMVGFQARKDENTTEDHKLQLYVQNFSKIDEIDNSGLPEYEFHFKSLDELQSLPEGSYGDFLGIMVKDWGTRFSPKNGTLLRDIAMVDGDGRTGNFTFFGELAKTFQFFEHRPVAIANISVSEYQGMPSFNVNGFPVIINPAEFPLAIERKRLFDETLGAIDMEVD